MNRLHFLIFSFLVAAFFGNVSDKVCSGEMFRLDSPNPGVSLNPGEVPGRKTDPALSQTFLPPTSPAVDSFGNRHSHPPGVRLTLPIRTVRGGGAVTRGDFMLCGDIRSLYGVVRPHLFFCRLLI